MTPRRRLGALLLVGLLPWSVVLTPGALTVVFAFGLVTPDPLHVTDLYSYLFVHTRGLPQFLLAWPVGVLLYLGALASAVSGAVVDREDHRLTAGLLVLAGLTQVTLAIGMGRRLGTAAVPVGALGLWAVAWWFEWPAIRDAT
jgi:uncharacterized protein (TIGR04206 family)